MAQSGLFPPLRRMSVFRYRADAFSCSPTCPLMTQSGHLEEERDSRWGQAGFRGFTRN
jgi:hypothetical protein